MARVNLRGWQGRPALRIIGLMSGTSADGVDVALIETDGESVAAFGPASTYPYDPARQATIRAAYGRFEANDATRAAEQVVTTSHLDAVRRFLADFAIDPGSVDLIGFHGQTISHKPAARFTWQIGDGAALAQSLGIPVVDGLRLADVAAGGQGAPLVPIYHAALVRNLTPPVAVVNIGGIGNVTWVGPDGDLLAFDTGPGNALLDRWISKRSGERFDRDGAISGAGEPIRDVVEIFRTSSYLSRRPPKSLDISELKIDLPVDVSLEDGAATLVCCTALAIAESRVHFPSSPTKWVISGGGSNNPSILRWISNLLLEVVSTADDLGWNSDALEAQAFAFLAARSVRGLPISFPRTTGCPAPMTGGRLHQP